MTIGHFALDVPHLGVAHLSVVDLGVPHCRVGQYNSSDISSTHPPFPQFNPSSPDPMSPFATFARCP